MEDKLNNEINKLIKLKQKIKNSLLTFPEGKLNIKTERGIPRYYRCIKNEDEETKLIYIKMKDISLAQTLAQKDYYKKALTYINKKLKYFEYSKKILDQGDLIDIYNNLSPVRKSLVTPVEPIWEEQVDAWYKKNYEKPDSKYDNLKLATKNGEFVRSKTERFMADFFFDNGIKYKYEKIIYLEGYGPASSDFTFLSPYTKEEIYWEHFGMVDNPEYALNMVKKINAYQMNGYVIGKNLIVTFESSKEVLNLNIVKSLVNEHLINNDKIK